ncbi:hypothetical protein HNP84_000050 [Thermocatellispora tengchongensis]|uniref:Uncharacterized protein n=1 Tax=Thermocatellispora tengchongensis TaxID=1073253 RepID=A0A840NSY1_9ACTN|nr:hypothetical protein [Thermocatellispora tengchongensis]
MRPPGRVRPAGGAASGWGWPMALTGRIAEKFRECHHSCGRCISVYRWIYSSHYQRASRGTEQPVG